METNTATIAIERDDARAKYSGFDEFDVIVENPIGSFPSGMYEKISEQVRRDADFSKLSDGDRFPVGAVTYTPENILSIEISDE